MAYRNILALSAARATPKENSAESEESTTASLVPSPTIDNVFYLIQLTLGGEEIGWSKR